MRRPDVTLAVVTMLAAAGCSAPARSPEAAAGSPEASRTTTTRAQSSDAVPFVLTTHCGIDEAKFQDRYYEAVHPLSDGSGNPPDGWGNPAQSGTMRAVSPTEAEFRHPAGQVVLFRLRVQATSFKRLCA
jgi:hypothetical protein